jgi:hypothetical protein
MPVSFATTVGRVHESVTVNATALSASTNYIASVSTADGRAQRFEFTTDGSGAASFQWTPTNRGVVTLTYQTKVIAPAGSATNTFTGV